MKLHLPKQLILAVMAAVAVAPALAAEYNVGTITGEMNFPSNSGNIVTFEDGDDGTVDGAFTLSGSDWLGAKDASGNKISSFGTLTYDYEGVKYYGEWKNPSTGTVSKNAKFDTLKVEGSAQIVLGGQYKSDVKAALFTDTYAEFTGIIANKVEVTDNATITSYNAQVGSLVAKGGTVKIHTSAYQGNEGMRLQGSVDSKQTQIHNLLKVSGTANVTIGATTKDGSLKDGHVATAFGSFSYTGDPSIEEGDETTDVDDYVTNVTDYNIHSSSIVQDGGTLNVYGKSLSIGGLHIDQTGGNMSISTGTNKKTEDGVVKSEVPMCHFLADYGDSTITQNGEKGTTLSIGLIKAYNKYYDQIVTSLKMNGQPMKDINPKLDVTQYGAGTINLNGVYFYNQKTGAASTDVSTIVQADHVDEVTGAVTATTGTINLAGAYEGATFDITQRAAGGSISLSGTMTAGTVTQDAGTLAVGSGAQLTASSLSVGGTLTNDGTLTTSGKMTASGTVDNNKNMVVQALEITGGTTTNAEDATLTAGSITVNGGTFVNYGNISSANSSMMTAEAEALAEATQVNLITIAKGEMKQYGTTTSNILVQEGGTLTLGVVKGQTVTTAVGAVTLEAGANMEVAGDSKTGALTLEGGTITFMEGATLTSDSVSGLKEVTIILNLSADTFANVVDGNGYTGTLFTVAGTSVLNNTTISVATEGKDAQLVQVKQDGNGNVTVGQLVPEPTTATLSLLALAALAARRRRR